MGEASTTGSVRLHSIPSGQAKNSVEEKVKKIQMQDLSGKIFRPLHKIINFKTYKLFSLQHVCQNLQSTTFIKKVAVAQK